MQCYAKHLFNRSHFMSELVFAGVLLVSDLDGTLVTERGDIPRRNISAIKRFIQKGGRFSFATGRSVPGTQRFASSVPTNAPSIVYNGGGIYDFAAETHLWSKNLPGTYKQIVKAVKKDFPDVGIEVYSGGSVYCVNRNRYTKEHIAFQGIRTVGADGAGELPDGNKVLFCGDGPRLEALAFYLKGMQLDGCRYVSSAPLYLELLPEGISKGAAVKVLAGLLGIAREKILGIGDYYNDLELIQTAAVGAAPAGAPEEIRQAADVVVGRSEDGAVADFIEYVEALFGT